MIARLEHAVMISLATTKSEARTLIHELIYRLSFEIALPISFSNSIFLGPIQAL